MVSVQVGELIGLTIQVHTCQNSCDTGLAGRVIDETRQTLLVETPNGRKRLIKSNCVFDIHLSSKWYRVPGNILVARPYDRIKGA